MALTQEQLEQLISAVRPQKKHFTHCTARYNGTRNPDTVKNFIDSIDFFKQSEDITDDNAIQGLRLLLEGPANTWWNGVKDDIRTWDQAKKAIRDEYSDLESVLLK